MNIFEWFIKIHWVWKLLSICGVVTVLQNILLIISNAIKLKRDKTMLEMMRLKKEKGDKDEEVKASE